MSYFTRSEILMGRDVQYPISPTQSRNLDLLIEALNPIREAWGRAMILSSGYRPSQINQSAGGAKMSAHMSCQAVDIVDKDGSFAEWCLNNLDILEECGVYLEDPRYTYIVDEEGNRVGGWVHLDIRGPKSGNRVFIPYSGPIKLKVV